MRCALVRRIVKLDAAGMRDAVAELLSGAGVGNDDIALMMPEVSTEVTVDALLEVETLLPRRTNHRIVQSSRVFDVSRRTEVTTVATYHYTSR